MNVNISKLKAKQDPANPSNGTSNGSTYSKQSDSYIRVATGLNHFLLSAATEGSTQHTLRKAQTALTG